jgi:hypothetical protein
MLPYRKSTNKKALYPKMKIRQADVRQGQLPDFDSILRK